jgi:hypothetical protein
VSGDREVSGRPRDDQQEAAEAVVLNNREGSEMADIAIGGATTYE